MCSDFISINLILVCMWCFTRYKDTARDLWILGWFPHNIQTIMEKIKLPKKTLSMGILWIKVRRSYRDLSWPRERKLNLKLSIFQLKRTFRVSWKHKNTRFRKALEQDAMFFRLGKAQNTCEIWFSCILIYTWNVFLVCKFLTFTKAYNCYEIYWHTLFQECFWSRIGSKNTRQRLVVLNPIKHSCSFFKH